VAAGDIQVLHRPTAGAKVRDVVGLYLNPPTNAVVLCVDEKSQIQALNRTAPMLPLREGLPERLTHDYRRNGTTTLFAALEVATGKVTDQCYDRHGKAEFLDFLKKVAKAYPRRKLHVVVDNYHTHKHAEINAWLARNPRVTLHFTPTSGSWLNLVEVFFGIITRKPSDADRSTTSRTSSPQSAPSSMAGTTAATRSPGPKPPTRSCPTPHRPTKLRTRDTRCPFGTPVCVCGMRPVAGGRYYGSLVTSHEVLATLSDDFWAGHLAAEPTEAHLLGYYPRTGRFEDASRAAEDREIARLRDVARRADQIDASELHEQERTTRAVLSSQATTRADLLEARLAEVSVNPIFGPQDALPLILGMLRLPDAAVADAMPDMLAGAGQWFVDNADRHREGITRGWAPAAFAVTETLAQIDRALARPMSEDPFRRGAAAALRDRCGRLARTAGSRGRVPAPPGLATYRDVLRDEVLQQARSDDRCGLTYLGGGDDAYGRTLR
jgi:transposase